MLQVVSSPSNDHINNFKDYGDFAWEKKQDDSSGSQHDHTQPSDLQVGVNSKNKTHLIFSSSWPYWDTNHQ